MLDVFELCTLVERTVDGDDAAERSLADRYPFRWNASRMANPPILDNLEALWRHLRQSGRPRDHETLFSIALKLKLLHSSWASAPSPELADARAQACYEAAISHNWTLFTMHYTARQIAGRLLPDPNTEEVKPRSDGELFCMSLFEELGERQATLPPWYLCHLIAETVGVMQRSLYRRSFLIPAFIHLYLFQRFLGYPRQSQIEKLLEELPSGTVFWERTKQPQQMREILSSYNNITQSRRISHISYLRESRSLPCDMVSKLRKHNFVLTDSMHHELQHSEYLEALTARLGQKLDRDLSVLTNLVAIDEIILQGLADIFTGIPAEEYWVAVVAAAQDPLSLSKNSAWQLLDSVVKAFSQHQHVVQTPRSDPSPLT